MFFSRINIGMPSEEEVRRVRWRCVQRVLRDMPWLWAVRSDWNAQSGIYVQNIPSAMWVLEDKRDYKCCHVYLADLHWQEVRRFEFTEETPSMYAVLDQIGRGGIPIEAIKYVATELRVLHGLTVWRPKDLGNMFRQCASLKRNSKIYTG